MINLLCFGDSNTFGTNPKGGRHAWNTRTPAGPVRSRILCHPEGNGRTHHGVGWNAFAA